ncbi:MAG: hypothetical protein JST84_09330 [Acidobacteria bacterium]|nr:hypothetical protein [Acidobacteriota bacterium]
MSAIITLPKELESLLAKKAAIKGLNVEQFALEALQRVAEMPTSSELFVDIERFIDIEASAKPTGNTEEEKQDATVGNAVSKVRRSTHGRADLSKEREWVRQHRDEYRGRWVVLDGDRLVGHAATAAEATQFVEQARAEGVRSPYIKLIPLDDEPIWMMWS